LWKPPERIRHRTDPGRWPSAAEAAASRLFSPIWIGPLRLRHRTWVPAMVPWRASEDGFVTDHVLDWYQRFAQGRPAALVIEATGIRDIPSGPLLRIGDDRFIAGLRRLAETVRRASGAETRLFIQLLDFLALRRRPAPERFFERYLEVTQSHRAALDMAAAPEAELRRRLASLSEAELAAVLTSAELEALRMGYRERVTDTHLAHIRELPEVLPDLFARAAARARAAGIDGVELHYAHAYTMASFLSATNDRDDGWGGDREGRLRLPLEVLARVRAAVGDDYSVGCRMLAEEAIAGGSEVEDTVFFAVEFARAGMDFISLSRGGKFDDAKQPAVGEAAYPYTGPSGYECMPQILSDRFGPFGRNLEATARIRRALAKAGLETPIVVAGGIHGFAQAEAILAEGKADIIAAARQSLADPDWFGKTLAGRGTEVRGCEYTNYCEGLDQKHKMVTCKLWDRTDLEAADLRLTADGKRRTTAPPW
jgi:2,4-dienoyl-CoA reductase-like NADH-dependent reductase (Old Yellow Enzyme family)